MMRKIDHLTVGWLDGSLRLLVDKNAALLERFPIALLTSVDSTTTLSSSAIGKTIVGAGHGCKSLGDGIIIPNGFIIDVAKSLNLLHGFDEAWFFEAEPSLPKPKEAWLVGPLNLNFDEVKSELSAWMRDTACKFGVGDGIGLNYATVDEEIARDIEISLTSERQR